MGSASSKAPVRGRTSSNPLPKRPCKRCKCLFSTQESLRALISAEGYAYYTIQEIPQHAQRGCPVCITIWKSYAFANYKQQVNVPQDWMLSLRVVPDNIPPSSTNTLQDYPPGLLSMRLLKLGSSKGHGYWVDAFTVHLPTDSDDPSAAYFNCLPVSYDMSSDFIINEVLRRLKECQEKHDKCHRGVAPFLPTRAIDVGNDFTDPKLFVPPSSERGFYATLSYCWGGEQQVKTTTENLHANMRNLPLQGMPQTFQDAIKITRKLGIQYLWIDALCIIQDSYDDKLKEINNMANIYKSATLTLAASNSKSARHGFLKCRPEDQGYTLPILLPTRKKGHITIVTCKEPGHDTYLPLDSRAWALQEALLSQRLLLFGGHGVRWQCQSVRREPLFISPVSYSRVLRLPPSVFGIHGVDAEGWDVDTKPGWYTKRTNLSQGERLLEEQSDIWQSICQNFAARAITQPTDRLPAISGVAGELERVWADTCFAGIFKKSFIKQLAWLVFSDYDKITQPRTEYLAPSWSWMAINGSIMIKHLSRYDAKFIDCVTIPVDSKARLGQLRGGFLTVQAPMLRADVEGADPVILPDFGWAENKTADTKKIKEKGLYLQLGEKYGDIGEKIDEGQAFGLVLMPAGDGNFRRVGTFNTPWNDENGAKRIFYRRAEIKVVTIV